MTNDNINWADQEVENAEILSQSTGSETSLWTGWDSRRGSNLYDQPQRAASHLRDREGEESLRSASIRSEYADLVGLLPARDASDADRSEDLWSTDLWVDCDERTNVSLSENGAGACRVDFDPPTQLEPLPWDLPSAGSTLHQADSCRPCLLLRTNIGCQKGELCDYCHFEHTRRQKMRPSKTKRDRFKRLVQRAENSMLEGSEGGVGSGNRTV